jgi:pyridoxamine 5'-phosphate oxidase
MTDKQHPFVLFSAWYEEARNSGLKEPGIMTLATVGNNNRPSARMVLLKGYSEEGFIFFTNYKSRKASEMEKHPWVSAVIHWESLGYQVRIEGKIEKIPSKDSDGYFITRPRGSQLSTWASDQSREIHSEKYLEQEMNKYREKFEGKPVPRPSNWGGYRIVPYLFEFWRDGKDRLHERIVYEWNNETWKRRILAP